MRLHSSRGPVAVVRTSLVVSAVIGIVLGLVAVFRPDATLVSVAVLFGIALVVAGLFRLIWALADGDLGNGARVALGLLGLVVLAAGVLALARPVATLVFVALLIGVSWVLNGVRDLAYGIRSAGAGRWLGVIAGAVSIIGGIVIFVLPLTALQTFTQVGGVLLVVVSVAGLLTLPIRSRGRA